jgi:hypothetical protein
LTDTAAQDVERIALACSLDDAALREQFLRFRGRAVEEARGVQCNELSWGNVMRHVVGRNARLAVDARVPLDALQVVVYRYFAFAFPTSGVEHGFTTSMRAFTIFHDACLPGYEDRMVRLHLGAGRWNADAFVARARSLDGSMGFCLSRASRSNQQRSDAGVSSKKRSGTPLTGSAAFLKRRRLGVATLAATTAREAAEADVARGLLIASWSDSHIKEQEFAETNQVARLQQAVREGALRPCEELLAGEGCYLLTS